MLTVSTCIMAIKSLQPFRYLALGDPVPVPRALGKMFLRSIVRANGSFRAHLRASSVHGIISQGNRALFCLPLCVESFGLTNGYGCMENGCAFTSNIEL